MLQRSAPDWICVGLVSVGLICLVISGIHMHRSVTLGGDAGKAKRMNIQNGGLLYLNSTPSYMQVTSTESSGRIEFGPWGEEHLDPKAQIQRSI